MASQGVARAEAVGWRQGQRVTRHRTVERARPTNGAPRRRCRLTTSRASHETLASSIGRTAGSRALSESRRPSARIARRSPTPRCAFGSSDVRRIGAEDVADFNQSLRDRGCSPSTRAKHLRVLGACLQAAVYYRFAESNAVRELPPAQRPRPESKEAAYFENSELPRLFAHLTEEPYRTLCLVALKTGMRQGELIALRWDDRRS